ncbi:TonB-dependent receptor [Novosphingobium cyanobacteriorum]|uniref:TonB-dependent receptor n=1 Tax=Novosphingobium cyanobacteriorum TaxID=3024215 RepID=A0ABT6CCA8_9SPHN|nr:TonB-dependent receptor [Novosphingobium cyanobacteriorum]MDF8331574.1 TonB-dependent receptor [Novosphingobium cyanobacteriorum]
MASHFSTRFAMLATTATIALFATPAMAQDAAQADAAGDINGNEIVVTATKRAQTIQEVPFSVNAQTAADIEKAGATSIEDISRSVAGLTVQNLGPGQSQVSVRGVSAGQIVRDQPGVKEQVGIYLDESVISLSLFTPDFDLFDLNRVETLRGPQGTLFGSGSVGGTVRYITSQPKLGRTEGQVAADVNVLKGGDVGYSGKAAVNLPLGEKAALRVVGYGEHFAGFINAVGPAAGKNVNDGERYGVRAAVLFEPVDGLKITPRVVYQDIKTNGFNRAEIYNIYASPLAGAAPLPENTQYLRLREGFRDKTTLADLTINAPIADGIEATSVTSYINRDIVVSRDASALTGSVYVSFSGAAPAALGGAALASNLRDTTKLKQWTQELRLSSTGTGPFQWVFGGFYTDVNRKYAQRLPTPGADVFSQAFLDAIAPGTPVSATYNGFPADSPYNADIPYKIKQFAVFGEASYKVGQFKLTAGGRYYDFKESRDFISGGVFANGDRNIGDKTKSNGFNPRFIVSYQPDRNLSVNLQASKGFRLGGVNDPLNIPLCSGGATGDDAKTYGNRPNYKDESLWNYEAGIKVGSGAVTFNAAAFYNDIRNLQVTADAGSCSSRVVFNVPKAHTAGVEFELSARPAKGFELAVNGSVIESKFDSTVTDANGVVIAGIRDGNRLPTVPKFQMSATASYITALSDTMDWTANASFQHVGNRFTQPSDQEAGAGSFTNSIFYNPATGAAGTGSYNFGSYQLPSYDLVNVSTGVSWQNGLSVLVYANNLFNKNPLLSLDRERGGRARLSYNVGSPRKIGVTVRKTF